MASKILKIGTPVLIVILIGIVLMAPIGPMPGFFIGGQETPVPDSWGETGAIHEVQLEVSGGALPRVVIIWFVKFDSTLHIVGAKGSGWVSMLGDGGDVRFRMGDNTYALHATLLTENQQPVLAAYIDKYIADYPDIIAGFGQPEEAAAGAAVFRLTP